MSQAAKQLKVKVGTLRRNLKDLDVTQREAAKEVDRLEKFRAEGKDDAALKQQQHCLDEARAGIPDAQKRIGAAAADLREFLAHHSEDPELQGAEDLTAAHDLLAQAAPALQLSGCCFV
jgi:hypothetical protein